MLHGLPVRPAPHEDAHHRLRCVRFHLIRVFHAAAVGLGLGHFDLFSGQQFGNAFPDVIARLARVSFRFGPVINRALVGEDTVFVDDKHMWGMVFMP